MNQPEILGAQKCLGKLQGFLNLSRSYLKKLCLVIQRNKNLTKFNCFIYCPFLFLKESLYLEILIKCSFFICCFLLLDSRTSRCVCVCVCVFWWEPLQYCHNKYYWAKPHQTISLSMSGLRVYLELLTMKLCLVYVTVKWTLRQYTVLMGLELKVSERGRLSKGAGQRRGLGKGSGWGTGRCGQLVREAILGLYTVTYPGLTAPAPML